MGENHWREVTLDDLVTVRIVCRHSVSVKGVSKPCGAVVQIPVAKLATVKDCPLCENQLRAVADPGTDPYRQLPAALAALKALRNVAISFVVPVED